MKYNKIRRPIYILSLIFLLILLLISLACSKDSATLPDKERGAIIDFSEGDIVTKNQIIDYVTELSAADIAIYDVTYYSITYRTVYKGAPIDTKGLIIIPNGVAIPELIAYFHGTQIALKLAIFEKEIPSAYDGRSKNFKEVRNMGLSWASAGYAVFMPDYIGYGHTIDEEHPYVYFPEMFESNIDGIIATRTFLTEKGFPVDKRLLLSGWSQGAGACLSAHKYIQNSYADKFTVIASSGLAGPYNFSGFLDDIVGRKSEDVNIAGIASWAMYSLNKFSDLKRPTDQIWSYPVYDQMSAISTPSRVPEKFLNNYFLAKIIDKTDVAFRKVLDANSFHKGWTPTGKVFLHHGVDDNVIPFFNSVDAYNGLTAEGGDVKIYPYDGGKHDTELGNYIIHTLNDFNTLR